MTALRFQTGKIRHPRPPFREKRERERERETERDRDLSLIHI